MLKKSLSVILAILIAFSGFSVGAFANTEEPLGETPASSEAVTYTAQYSSRVKTDIVLLSTAKNELTVINPGDSVKFVDQKGQYINKPLAVTYYADVDALLKSDIKNDAFLTSHFDSYNNNIYKDVTASFASGASFFRDDLPATANAEDTMNNALYTVKGIGDISTSYCNVGEVLAEQEIDFSFDSNRGKFLGWVAQTARATATGHTLDLFALWEKDARTTYTIKAADPENNEIESIVNYGYVGEEVTVFPSEYSGYASVSESKTITLDANPENNIVKFDYTVLNIKYIVRCVDKSNNVLKEETFEAQEGSITINAPEIQDYTPVVNSSTKTITLSRNEETPVVVFTYDSAVVEVPQKGFIARLKSFLISKIIEMLCTIEAVNEVLTDELFLGMTVSDLLDMLVEVGFATLIVRLFPALKELIPFQMLWDELGI